VREIRPLTDEELGRVVGELGGSHGSLVTLAAETGLRPCEWLALERRAVDKAGRVLYVDREHVGGETKAYLETTASRRSVPLAAAALDALDDLPTRLDSPLVFPSVRGGYLDLRN
jgi:integrase